MTKKSIFGDQFSWKVCNFAGVLFTTRLFVAQISDTNRDLDSRLSEQDQIRIGAAFHSAVSNHNEFGAVAGLCQSMDGACAFFMPIS